MYPRSRAKLYVDYLYLESIVGSDLRRIFATDIVQLGMCPFAWLLQRMHPVARSRAEPPTLARAWTKALSAAANPKVTLSPARYLKIFGTPLFPAVRVLPHATRGWFTRSHVRFLAARPRGRALQARLVR